MAEAPAPRVFNWIPKEQRESPPWIKGTRPWVVTARFEPETPRAGDA